MRDDLEEIGLTGAEIPMTPALRRKIAAETLREAANRWDEITHTDRGRGTAAFEECIRPLRDETSAWLRAMAANYERGGK